MHCLFPGGIQNLHIISDILYYLYILVLKYVLYVHMCSKSFFPLYFIALYFRFGIWHQFFFLTWVGPESTLYRVGSHGSNLKSLNFLVFDHMMKRMTLSATNFTTQPVNLNNKWHPLNSCQQVFYNNLIHHGQQKSQCCRLQWVTLSLLLTPIKQEYPISLVGWSTFCIFFSLEYSTMALQETKVNWLKMKDRAIYNKAHPQRTLMGPKIPIRMISFVTFLTLSRSHSLKKLISIIFYII